MVATQKTPVTHIRIDDRGVAWVDDTNVKVVEVVLDKLAHGWSPEEIQFQHYERLSLAQIYAALAYYHDHREHMDKQIAADDVEFGKLRATAGESLA